MTKCALAIAFLVLVSPMSPAQAARYPEDKLPPTLAPWVDWVRYEIPEASCARFDGETECLWPGRLTLKVGAKGGEFALDLVADRVLQMPLPGGKGAWPQDVKVNERPAVVLSSDDAPITEVQAGPARVTGRFEWARLPQSLTVDAGVALIDLTVGGKRHDVPRRDGDLLWLSPEGSEDGTEAAEQVEPTDDAEGPDQAEDDDEAPVEADSLSLLVARKIEDGIPVSVTTHVVLRVAGKAREGNLGPVLLEGCAPVELDSQLPAHVDDKGDVRVQLRAGTWTLALACRVEGNAESLTLAPRPEPWPPEEVWVWQADRTLRQVTVEGLTGIDPTRTSLPSEWHRLPTYQVKPGDRMVLKTTRRGQPDPAPDQLGLARALWLDPDGGGYTVHDHLSGALSRTWRLNLDAPAQLGHVYLPQGNQLITADPAADSGLPGVEVRTGTLDLWSEARLEERPSELPAVGWSTDVQRLEVTLHLPPGWDVLALTGADHVSRGWFDAWNLGCLILVLLGSAAAGRLLGWRWGLVSLVALGLGQAWDDAPYATWFAALAAVALLRFVPEGRWRDAARAAWLVVMVGFVVVLTPFAARQVRLGLFPQVRYLSGSPFFPSGSVADILRTDRAVLVARDASVAPEAAGMDKLNELAAREHVAAPAARAGDWGGGLDPFGGHVGAGGGFRGTATIGGYGGLQGLARKAKLAEGEEGKFGDPDVDPDRASKSPRREGKMMKEIDPKKVGLNDLLAEDARRQENRLAVAAVGDERAPTGVEADEARRQRDPNAVIQTGPGVPDWRWESWVVTWDGPVSRGHVIRPWLIGPLANLVLALLRGLLWLALAGVVVARCRGALWPPRGARPSPGNDPGAAVPPNPAPATTAVIAALVATTLLAAAPARAQVPCEPSSALLDELRGRLSRIPDCAPDCVSVSRLALEVQGDELTLRADVHSGDHSAWKLPGGATNWTPRIVRVDGAPTAALALRDNGFLAVRLGPGRHVVEAQGPMPAAGFLTLEFADAPERVVADAPGWSLTGLQEEGTIDSAVSFTRKAPKKGATAQPAVEAPVATAPEAPVAAAPEATAPGGTALPPWLEVIRVLDIGVPWLVQTTVRRVSPTGSPVLLKVPLLTGEAITSTDVRTEDGQAVVSLGQDDTQVAWTSTLAERRDAPLVLTAPSGVPWSEIWVLRCGPVWQCDASGLAPIQHQAGDRWAPQFRPWPGESLTLGFRLPPGVAGASVTVDQADLSLTPGPRLTSARLLARLRTSQGGAHRLELPEGARVQSVSLDGRSEPIQQEGGALSLTLKPGEHTFRVDWQTDAGLAPLQRVPAVGLGAAVANGRVQIELPEDRWVLFVGGPEWGPTVLFWSQLLVLLGLAFALGRVPLSPLRSWQWMLLVPGLSLVPFEAALVVVAWFFLLAARKASARPGRSSVFDALQVLLVAWTALALTVFYAAVVAGLHHPPDMQVAGLGSTAQLLSWYSWQPGATLPTPWVVSLPGWAWKILAGAWTLWLAASLFTWLRWGFACWSEGGRWAPIRWRRPGKDAAAPESPAEGQSV